MDQLLASFMESPEGLASEQELGDLLARDAAPLIRRIVSRRLGGSFNEADDVCSQVLLQLVVRLRQGKSDAELDGIAAFTSYVAAAAHHGCDHYLRSKYPLRWRLRNRIRYVLEHDPRLAVWKDNEENWLCGFAPWRSRPPDRSTRPPDPPLHIQTADLRGLLMQTFQQSGAPVELNAVVERAASILGIPLFAHEANDHIESVPDSKPAIDVKLAQRGNAQRLWAQIRELPIRQRHALLLNLKDDAIALFLTTGAASLRAIAESLEMPVEAFAALWNDLPLSDNDLAARLGCTRQQVINLRMSARKRLAHRFAGAS
jgi:RNA polymerase sigma factor (sigma-70 family)